MQTQLFKSMVQKVIDYEKPRSHESRCCCCRENPETAVSCFCEFADVNLHSILIKEIVQVILLSFIIKEI